MLRTPQINVVTFSAIEAVQKHLRHPGGHADDVTTPSEVKCVILGQTEAGKTSLLNCMMKGQGHVEIETNRTIGVDVIPYHDTKNNVKYEMYDFGGHQIYHYTHRFFLTRQALHILNVDLPGYKSEEFQERVRTWLTSVTSHVFNPAILVVGTKVDLFPPDKAEEMIAAACSSIQRGIHVAESKIQAKLNEEIQLCQKAVDAADGKSDMTGPFYGLTRDDILAKKESLEKLLDGRPKGVLNVQVIPVSSKTFQGIEALCDKMAEMVKDERLFPAARQELSASWTELSENIKTSGRPYLHVRDCQDVGAAAGMKESDVLNALSHLHVTGQILFYNNIRGMEDLVFPDPTIILTLFKQIFRHDLPAYLDSIAESLSEHTRAHFAEDRESFLKTGRASDSFMKNLLGDNIATFNSLLPLMKHFGLCYSGSVIFPTELPAAQPDEVARCWPEVVPSGGEEISVTIEYSQEPPLGLPETMISRILSMEQTTRRLLTKDTVVVHVGENAEDVMYRHFPTREEIRIRGEPEKAWRQAQTVAKVMEALTVLEVEKQQSRSL
ncbi:probable serine/threonine-protein kinase qkgA [Branchiostoma floridae]|uniref:Probable serine/threonine-protein kinase qkgA n=1 Tax=Branchiostoma floridae TaxID=7739 RepID=A0A9J7KTI4_BRAFL|nr:probable serine/threonine-protein kinase qkgA [Branchiostoma floridae]